MRRLLFVTVTLAGAAASAAVPNIFVAGQPASALQVNQNFQYVDQRASGAIGALITRGYSASSDLSTSVASVTCATNSIVLSANCSCSSAGNTRNYGVLFGCAVAGNGGVVGCFSDAGSFNSNLPPPRGEITIVCLSGLQVDGTPLFATPLPKVRENADELESKESEVRQMETDHTAAMRSAR